MWDQVRRVRPCDKQRDKSQQGVLVLVTSAPIHGDGTKKYRVAP